MTLAALQDRKSTHGNLLHSCTLSIKDHKEIQGATPFTIAATRIKCLGVNLPEEAKALRPAEAEEGGKGCFRASRKQVGAERAASGGSQLIPILDT